jgi:hypothetical protein
MVIIMVGLGSLGILTAAIAARFVELNVETKLGERRIKMRDHLIVCSTDEGMSEIVREFNESELEVVLVDAVDHKAPIRAALLLRRSVR